MNRQVRQVLELGLFFAGAVILLDVVLAQMQILVWFALAVTFLFVAAIILASVARNVSTQKAVARLRHQKEDPFQELAENVDAAVYAHDRKSLRIVWERLNSLALSAVAARTRLSKKEVLELAKNDKSALEGIVKDVWMVKLLIGYQPRDEPTSEDELEKILSEIENWSH
jgi:Na+(H+)/acetate symporter ActP